MPKHQLALVLLAFLLTYSAVMPARQRESADGRLVSEIEGTERPLAEDLTPFPRSPLMTPKPLLHKDLT